ncbi:UbiA family prenyltransferase [Streptomyces sp. NBC_01803]|uniref:UbiA family prenyltransferase n=1 Tax=Streptomyces sp. NBC_01803 TaxID=2975946 RepID=UPI002DDBF852|nr:UbiA family prenyltransferase [Streptomyces sp. NBC_01803]WSA44272.1 UbiA family prenyltransferase [Streptomyces sp. NBC_01803]
MQAIFLVRFLVGAALADGGRLTGWGPWLIGPALCWALAAAFAYGLNGVSDVAEDRVNGTGRPIARGDLSPESAARMTWLCAAGAVAFALLAGNVALLGCVLAFLLIGCAYSAGPWPLKRSTTATSAAVLAMGLLSYASGWLASGVGRPSGASVVLAVGMALWMAAVGAVTKDFAHAEGDAAAGRRTSVTAWGEAPARWVAALGALGVAAGFAVAARPYAAVLAPTAGVLAVGAGAVAVLCWTTRHDADRAGEPYRAFMVTQHIAHVVLLARLAEVV